MTMVELSRCTPGRDASHFPGSPVIGRHAPAPQGGAEKALSSSHDTLLTVPRPLRRRVPRHPLHAPRCLPWPSPRLVQARPPLDPFRANDGAAGFASCRGPASCLHPASTPTSRPTPGASLPGPWRLPGPGPTPAGCRELVARLRHEVVSFATAPELLDAHQYVRAVLAGVMITSGISSSHRLGFSTWVTRWLLVVIGRVDGSLSVTLTLRNDPRTWGRGPPFPQILDRLQRSSQ